MPKNAKDLQNVFSMGEIGKVAVNPQDVLALVNTLANGYLKVHEINETQITERSRIESEAKIQIERINSQKQIILEYLNRSFDERKDVLRKQFDVVDAALQQGNIQILAQGLDSIKSTMESSPLKDLANFEAVTRGLQDKEKVWDI